MTQGQCRRLRRGHDLVITVVVVVNAPTSRVIMLIIITIARAQMVLVIGYES